MPWQWIKNTLVSYETISETDLALIKITDDPKEVLDFMITHRAWRNRQ
jgi:predicted Rossmann-fold nucleotide-binding protein